VERYRAREDRERDRDGERERGGGRKGERMLTDSG
jgi:hypothetical protein